MDHPLSRALVTGASAGLGEAFARQLGARGLDLVLVARRRGELEALADQLSGDGVEVLPADLTAADERARVEERLRDTERPVDLLVNNAGFGTYGEFVRLPLDRQLAMVQLNVAAVVALTHAALGPLRARRRGGVINLASLAAFQPDPHAAVYGATKAFVLSFTQALHEELRGTGVRAMAVAPGIVRTEFQDVAGIELPALPGPIDLPADEVVARALADFTRGRAVSIPGILNAIGARGSELTPTVISRKLSGLLHARLPADD